MKLTAKEVTSRFEVLKQERVTWEDLWQELADYIIPRKSNVTRKVSSGDKRNDLFDNTGINANEQLASALHSMLTSPNSQWFELVAEDPILETNSRVLQYLEDLTRRVHKVLNGSNFQTEIHEVYLDIGSFGTTAMFIDEDEENVVNFSTRHISEIFIGENHRGRIDEVLRVFKWSARQIIQSFLDGIDDKNASEIKGVVGEKVYNSFVKGDGQEFEIIHAVYKEDIANKESPFKYISQYVLKDEGFELSSKGFNTFPFAVSRFAQASDEKYGRSPGMNALPELRTLNAMTRTTLKGAQKTIDPPIQLPDDGFVHPIKTKPGSINYYRAGSQDRAQPIFNDSRIDFGFEWMNDKKQRVLESFFVDKLQLMANDRMTTTEVNQRVQEQQRQLGPMLGRQQQELLRPILDRVIEIMTRQDQDGELIGNPPEEIQGRNVDVQYSSQIARAQRANEGEAILRAMQAAEPFINMDQKAIDNFKADEAVRRIWRIYGASSDVLADRDTVAQKRQAREQAQRRAIKQQEQSQDAETISKTGPAAAQAARAVKDIQNNQGNGGQNG